MTFEINGLNIPLAELEGADESEGIFACVLKKAKEADVAVETSKKTGPNTFRINDDLFMWTYGDDDTFDIAETESLSDAYEEHQGMGRTLTDDVCECLAGCSSDVAKQQDRVVAFMVEKRDNAEDPDSWFDDHYQELLDHETLGDDIADVRENIWQRCQITETDDEMEESFDMAFEQFLDCQ